ncbi:unnamed protein product [Closterium sp. NIES-53]
MTRTRCGGLWCTGACVGEGRQRGGRGESGFRQFLSATASSPNLLALLGAPPTQNQHLPTSPARPCHSLPTPFSLPPFTPLPLPRLPSPPLPPTHPSTSLRASAAQELVVDAGAIQLAVRSLSRDVGESRQAVALLLELSKSPKVCEEIGRAQGSILLLVTMLNNENANAAKDAAAVLQQLASNDQNVVQMAEANHFKPLADRLTTGRLPCLPAAAAAAAAAAARIFCCGVAGELLLLLLLLGCC